MKRICVSLEDEIGALLGTLSNVEKKKIMNNALMFYLKQDGVIEDFFEKKGQYIFSFAKQVVADEEAKIKDKVTNITKQTDEIDENENKKVEESEEIKDENENKTNKGGVYF